VGGINLLYKHILSQENKSKNKKRIKGKTRVTYTGGVGGLIF